MFNLILIYSSAGDGLFKPSKLLTSASTEFIYDGESLWTEIKTLRLQQGPNIFWYRFLLPPPPWYWAKIWFGGPSFITLPENLKGDILANFFMQEG